jgi:voltage-gated potassium channel
MSAREPASGSRPGLRRRVQFILDSGHAAGTLGAIYEAALIALIVTNVVAVSLETVPSIRAAMPGFFAGFEAVSVALFTIEYAARLWSVPEDPRFARFPPLAGRLRYALQPLMLIDLLAIAPTYIALVMPVLDLRMLRLFRLLRLLKIARYSPALTTFAHVIVSERRALLGTLLLLICVMCFSAEAMYLAEATVQPRTFGTLPDAMWWAITTLTTVGYGDAVPVTALGKAIAGMTMIMGLGLFALPVGIVATGFVNEIRRRDFVVTWGMLSRMKLFEGFDTEIIGDVMSALRSHVVSAETRIFASGAHPEAMYFIVSGEAEVEHPEEGARRLGPGDFFGEIDLLHAKPYRANVTARSNARLLILGAEDFHGLLRKHAKLKSRIEEHAAAHAARNARV